MKIHPVGTELFHGDGQTYDEANSRFSLFFRTRVEMALRIVYFASDNMN